MTIQFVKTICPYCGCGCGILLEIVDQTIVAARPDNDHPVSRGRLCIKGWHAHEFVHHPDRLTHPLAKNRGRFHKISWDEAMDIAIDRLSSAAGRAGPAGIGGFSSARCTNEENYLFQKFIRAGFGTNNVDHCARLCHGPTAVAMARAFGSGAMTNSIQDVVLSDCILMFGSNAPETHPIIMGRIYEAQAAGARLIVVDPRRTAAAQNATLHLAVTPGGDIPLINGMMRHILDAGLEDRAFISERTQGFEDMARHLDQWPLERAAGLSGIAGNQICAAAEQYAGAQRASLFFCMGITQHSFGTANVHALCNLAMLCGQVGRPGAGVNPLRGQNNVQGACDVGALPDYLPGYQRVADPGARSIFEAAWKRPLSAEPGLTLTEMTAVAGETIRALYIMGENPMMSDPDINEVKTRLKRLDFLMVQDIFMTETAKMADLVLPGACFAEKNGTFTNTERRVQRVRAAVPPPGDALDDFSILCRLGNKLGLDFNYADSSQALVELSCLAPIYGGIDFQRVAPHGLQWPCPTHDHPGTPCLHQGVFSRGQGLFVIPEFALPAESADEGYPFALITGRMFAHYHTGTMSRRSEALNREAETAFVQIHPDDAGDRGISEGDRVRVSTRRGSIDLSACLTPCIRPGSMFIPFHFSEAPANALTFAVLDPVSKIPSFKLCAAGLERGKNDDTHGA
jgi:formate dehydrogenase alpha subunit